MISLLTDIRLSEKKANAKKEAATSPTRKRIEAFIREEKVHDVLLALNKIGQPATFHDSKGIGKGEKYQIRYGRHGDITTMAYSNRRTVETVVDEDNVDEVVSLIKEAAQISKSGAGGIIVVSPVDDVITI